MSLRCALTAPFRNLRTGWRLLQVALLVLGGMLVVRCLFPFWSAALRQRVKQLWAAFLVDSLGVTIDCSATRLPPRSLIVCNHISWLDVFVINAVAPTTFVCKDDVRDWPLLGWLVEHTGTLFIERGSRAAAARSAGMMTRRLDEGERVAVFPEGTTTRGDHMQPFRPALFEAAVAAQVPVQPLGLRYLERHGERSLAPAYEGDTSFAQSMLAIAGASGLHARLTCLPSLPAGQSRRELATASEYAIARALSFRPEVVSEADDALTTPVAATAS